MIHVSLLKERKWERTEIMPVYLEHWRQKQRRQEEPMENQGLRKRLPRRDRSPRLAGTRRLSNSSLGNSTGTKTSWKNSSVRTVRIQWSILCFIPFGWSKSCSHVLFYLFLRKTKKIISFISFLIYCVMNNCSISWKKDWIEKAEDKVIHQHVL